MYTGFRQETCGVEITHYYKRSICIEVKEIAMDCTPIGPEVCKLKNIICSEKVQVWTNCENNLTDCMDGGM